MKITYSCNPHKKGFTVPHSIHCVCKLNSYKITTGGLTFKCARWYSKRTFALAMLSTVPTNTKGTWPSSRGIVGCGSLSPSILTRTWNKHGWETTVPFQSWHTNYNVVINTRHTEVPPQHLKLCTINTLLFKISMKNRIPRDTISFLALRCPIL